eukprot:PhM_4_TR8204/c0_g1_i2/m.2760/K08281/pncA; nicotinamidase/pyrazinamidase
MPNVFAPKGPGGLKSRCALCSQHIDMHVGPMKLCSSENAAATSPATANPLLEEYQELLSHEGVAITSSIPTLSNNDVLVVVDMQNDFLPGGSFGVAEGFATCPKIVEMIETASKRGATIVATRDYHPKDHCSFNAQGGPYPSHCVQGGPGAYFETTIGKALAEARKRSPDRVKIVFKGFNRTVDSYGAFPYPEDYANGRISGFSGGDTCCLAWTGAFDLMCSYQDFDINAPPDVMSVTERKSLQEIARPGHGGRVIVCGLALDFCVLDTIVTAGAVGLETVLVLDAARAAHIPGFGKFGTGFLTDPRWFAEQLRRAGATTTYTSSVVA